MLKGRRLAWLLNFTFVLSAVLFSGYVPENSLLSQKNHTPSEVAFSYSTRSKRPVHYDQPLVSSVSSALCLFGRTTKNTCALFQYEKAIQTKIKRNRMLPVTIRKQKKNPETRYSSRDPEEIIVLHARG